MGARTPKGNKDGLSGYAVSKYSAIFIESDTAFPFALSKMTGSVYIGDPSGFTVVGSAPISFILGSISPISTHSVLNGSPLKASANLEVGNHSELNRVLVYERKKEGYLVFSVFVENAFPGSFEGIS